MILVYIWSVLCIVMGLSMFVFIRKFPEQFAAQPGFKSLCRVMGTIYLIGGIGIWVIDFLTG